ncbi:MAG: DoxX family membrane protein, partial [Geminicoccaceae bacterium]
MTVERQIGSGSKWQEIGGLFERANAIVRALAQPSLTQLVLRFALAVPFWRSGVNKWDGFLQLNDVAVLLFSSEFKLHLPGGPYGFPAPGVVAFAAGSAEILLPI